MKFDKIYNTLFEAHVGEDWLQKTAKDLFKDIKVVAEFDDYENETRKATSLFEIHPGEVMIYHLLVNDEYAKVVVYNTSRRFSDVTFIDWPASAQYDVKTKFNGNGSNYMHAIKPYIINAIKVWDAEQKGLSHDQAKTAVRI